MYENGTVPIVFFFFYCCSPGMTLGGQFSRYNVWSIKLHLVWGQASARSPPSATGDSCSPGGWVVGSALLLHRDVSCVVCSACSQECVVWSVLPVYRDVLCGLFCLFAEMCCVVCPACSQGCAVWSVLLHGDVLCGLFFSTGM